MDKPLRKRELTDSIVSGKIYKTKDFDSFKMIKANRKIGSLNRLEKAAKTVGLLSPIIVNENLEIIDGQHRFLVCQKIDMPVEYIVRTGSGMDEVISANTTTKNWKIKDYVDSYAEEKFEDYELLQEIVENNKVSISYFIDIAYLNKTGSSSVQGGGGKSSTLAVKEGNFQFYNYNHFVNYLNQYLHFVDATGVKNSKVLFQGFFRIWSLEKFDLKRLINKKAQLLTAMKGHSSREDIMRVILEVYNSKLSSDSKRAINYGYDYKMNLTFFENKKEIEDQRK